MSAKEAEKRNISQRQSFAEPKPFVKWAGGKTALLDELGKMLPQDGERVFKKYCEPMVGGGALLFYVLSKYDFEEIYISDINAELINAYNVIKNNVSELIERLEEMQMFFSSADESKKKTFYYDMRSKFNTTELSGEKAAEKAAYLIFLNKTCFNGLYRVNSKGHYNVPMGSYKNPGICDAENLRNIHTALQNVIIRHGDYSMSEKFIDKNTFVYIDPPYRPICKTSFTSYNGCSFDDGDQIRLARFVDKINRTGAKIVLSNSDPKNKDKEDVFFDELYKDYEIKRVSAATMINSKADGRGKINELLITN